MTVALAVTVSSAAAPGLVAEARAMALRWGLPYFERPRKSGLEEAFEGVAEAFLVREHDGWALRTPTSVLRFTPGMAALRIKRIAAGYPLDDVLVKLGELRAGDVVVDGTLGLGADALVAATVVGPTGRVIGVEASLPLYALVSEGLRTFSLPIEVRHASSQEVLAALPTRSVDVVMFDPMFDAPKKSSPAFELLRRFADHTPLAAETLAEARRVARRWVLVKAGRRSQTFARLGLEPAQTSRFNPTVWARVAPLP